MQRDAQRPGNGVMAGVPNWVPDGAQNYLAHTERGASIRALARAAGCHASTILRQIRKIETRRDDPLVDAALRKLGEGAPVQALQPTGRRKKGAGMAISKPDNIPDEETLLKEAPNVLRRLCESGAVLAVAAEMEKAVVVREMPGGGTARTAIVDASLAQALALKEWIAPLKQGRVVKYRITSAGRAALEEMILRAPSGPASVKLPSGMAEAPQEWLEAEESPAESPRKQRMRYALTESPLIALARRRDTNGKPFLSDAMVTAGERLREDFELARLDGRPEINWNDPTEKNGTRGCDAPQTERAATDARGRVAAALAHLGPGLSDVALRCCCYLEGLETTEKRLGWSARSGKVVLRIALMRLQLYYDKTIGLSGPMIG